MDPVTCPGCESVVDYRRHHDCPNCQEPLSQGGGAVFLGP